MARLRYNALDVPALTGDIAAEAGPTAVTFSDPLREYGTTAIPDIVAPDYLPLYRAGEVVYLTAYDDSTLAGTISRAQEDSTAVAHTAADTATTPFKHGPTKEDRPPLVGCKVTLSVDGGTSSEASVADSTLGVIGWDAEEFDTHGFHLTDTALNRKRLAVPAGEDGFYELGYVLDSNASLATAGARAVATVRKNGVAFVKGSRGSAATPTVAGNRYLSVASATVVYLASGDYIEVEIFQQTGSSFVCEADTSAFWMYKVGT